MADNTLPQNSTSPQDALERIANWLETSGGKLTRTQVKQMVEFALDAAQAAPSAAQWMRIETAPKDGTRVLTATVNGGGYPAVSWWAKLDMTDPEYGAHAWCPTGAHVPWGHQPTHWMPLPLAPGAAQQIAHSGMSEGRCSSDCEWTLCDCDQRAVKAVPAREEMNAPANSSASTTGDFGQVLREMEGVARGEDANPEFDDEQMALIADWRARLLVSCVIAPDGAVAKSDDAWIGS